GMVGKLFTDPKQRDTLIEILSEGIETMKGLAGCHLYVVSKDSDDEGTVWVMELWESKEAHDLSLTMPEIRDLIARAMPILKGIPEGASLLPIVGKGLSA